MRTEMPKAAKQGVNGNFNEILRKLSLSEAVHADDWAVSECMVQGIRGRFGGCTFDFQTALRVLLTHKEKCERGEADAARWAVPAPHLAEIKDAFLGYRFFMTMPGADSMVLWSENLQIQLAVNEYFTALLWPDAIFTADGKSAAAHLAHAQSRVEIWLRQRWLYGFAEWNSPTYYVEDISPLCLLIDFVPNAQIRERTKIILDLLLYDLAVGQQDGIFSSTAGRCYPAGRRIAEIEKINKDGTLTLYNSIGAVIEELCSEGVYAELHGVDGIRIQKGSPNSILNNFKYRKKDGYVIPPVLRHIALDRNHRVCRASHGLYLRELRAKGLIGQSDAQIMLQWAMEAFSNPEVLRSTLRYCRAHKLFGNANFRELRFFNIPLLRGLLPTLSKWLNLFPNGIALERANTYTYRTPHYLQACAQIYCPKSHGAQQHLWCVNFGEFAVFAANPYAEFGRGSHWTGDGVKPFAAQEKNVTLAVYDTRVSGVKIRKIHRYSQAHFPLALFDAVDESKMDGGMIFGEKDGAYIALLAGKPLRFAVGEETARDGLQKYRLVQEGAVTYWICETGSCETESFAAFCERTAQNKREFDGKRLRYYSRGVPYELTEKAQFFAAGEAQNLEYKRFDSDFVKGEREAEEYTFLHSGKALHIHFEKAVRRIDNGTEEAHGEG